MKNLNFNEMQATQGGGGYWSCSQLGFITPDNYGEVESFFLNFGFLLGINGAPNFERYLQDNCTAGYDPSVLGGGDGTTIDPGEGNGGGDSIAIMI